MLLLCMISCYYVDCSRANYHIGQPSLPYTADGWRIAIYEHRERESNKDRGLVGIDTAKHLGNGLSFHHSFRNETFNGNLYYSDGGAN